MRRAVERCGGSVAVRDNPGGGTVFEVRLPAVARLWHVAAAYVGLTKPRIIELLLVTTVPAMMLGVLLPHVTYLAVRTVEP